MNNKIGSDKQEKMVARYLGWKQVTGSGARPGLLGDVSGTEWLGECKTHNEPTPHEKVTFYKDHWKKISTEAYGTFKRPVLFTDDGTQRYDHTWCIFNSTNIKTEHVLWYKKPQLETYLHINKKTISFNSTELKNHLIDINVEYIQLADLSLLCTLKTFSEVVDK